MKQTFYSLDLHFVPWLTFFSFIGMQALILLSSATPLIDEGVNGDESNTTTKSILEEKYKGLSSPSLDSGVIALKSTMSTFTIPSPYKSKTSFDITETVKIENIFNGSNTIVTNMETVAVPTRTNSSLGTQSIKILRSTLATSTSPLTTMDVARTFRNKYHHEHHGGPFFEEPLNSSITRNYLISSAHLFTEAALNCRVGMLKDKTVMWVKRTTDKVSLLTVGNITYSGDPRIRVKFQYPNNWRLLINPIQKEDAGIYMCQVSTHPPKVFTTNLTILEPPLRLTDDQDRDVRNRYYKIGSTIELKCQVVKSFLLKDKLTIPKALQPYDQNHTKANSHKGHTIFNRFGTGHNELFLSTTPNNTKISRTMAKLKLNNTFIWTKDEEPLPSTTIERLSLSEKWLTSRISIPNAKVADSGNYKCSIGQIYTAIVQVLVLTGELPAAVQHNSAAKKTLREPLNSHLIGFYFTIYLIFNIISRH